MNNKVIVAILGLIVVLLAFIGIFNGIFLDKNGPVITFDSGENIVYTEGQDESVLIQGVVAVDKKDGDVSDSIRVDSTIIDGDVIKVKYAAKDSNNNVTISDSYREIKYIPANVENVSTDVNDSKTDESVNGNSDTNNETEESTTTDFTGEIDKEIADKTGIPVITLTANEIMINEGETFNALEYVKETYDNSGDVSRRIRVTGNEEKLVVGDYNITYVVSDTEGNVSEPAVLVVHVKKGNEQ